MIKHLLLSLAVAIPATAAATDYFVTPDGAGEKTGTSWTDAMGLAEYYAHMKYTFNVTPVNDSHTGEDFYFATGRYVFTQTVFIYRSNATLRGGYDPTTGQLASTGRTLFDGNNQSRKNGALAIMPNTEQTSDNVTSRAVSIDNIDFENFITTGEWKGDNTNWQPCLPGAIYIFQCGQAEISNCNFRNNTCTATGSNAMPGALSLNCVNAIVRNCSFTGNVGTDGGALKLYYNKSGDWTKNAYLVVDRCYFTGNTSNERGGAIYARNAMTVNIINSTIANNTATLGAGVFNNSAGNYNQQLNIISSTIAGNTGNGQIYVMEAAPLKVANSIIPTPPQEGSAVKSSTDATSGFVFQGHNLIGTVAEGYTATATDLIDAANTYEEVFGSNVLEVNGTLKPAKFMAGMLPADISDIMAGETWKFTANPAVDQLGNPRTASTSNGALAVTEDVSTIITLTVDDQTLTDDSYYTLQGIRLTSRPTIKGLYIHKGKKVVIQ